MRRGAASWRYRASLGATGWRLVRHSLTESILLGIAGGVGVCSSRTGAFLDCMPSGSPSRWTFGLSGLVVVLTFGVGLAAGAATGIATILRMLRRDPAHALREEGTTVMTGRQTARLRSGLVVVQVSVSLVLLVGAGLSLRTLQNAYTVDPG